MIATYNRKQKILATLNMIAGLSQRLNVLLEDIDSTSKWHPIKNYQDQSQALTYLLQMDAIQFSPRKGLIHRK